MKEMTNVKVKEMKEKRYGLLVFGFFLVILIILSISLIHFLFDIMLIPQTINITALP